MFIKKMYIMNITNIINVYIKYEYIKLHRIKIILHFNAIIIVLIRVLIKQSIIHHITYYNIISFNRKI